MANNINNVLDYLAKAEGLEIHYNSTEKDITSPFGIYRAQQPNADMFKFIDKIAQSVGVTSPSRSWTSIQLAQVNKELSKYSNEVRGLAEIFYTEFLKGAHLELFPAECTLAMYSMYTNSPLNAWKSVQESLLDMSKTGSFTFSGALSSVDGGFGDKTKNALSEILSKGDTYLNYYLETLMLSAMKTIYIKIAIANPEDIKYLIGWSNRMDKLAEMR